jgi:hypothetical protein
MNCESLSFSQKLSEQRISQAETLLGKKIIRKILAYALFLLGVNRSSISTFLNMAPGSIRSLVLAMKLRGLAGLEDQRSKTSSFKPPRPEQIVPTLEADDSWLKVDFNVGNLLLRIPKSNSIQKRVVLLSLANNGLLSRSTVAGALGLSIDRIGKLTRNLEQEDVKGILDQRQGQRQDYRFTPEIKAELIQQWTRLVFRLQLRVLLQPWDTLKTTLQERDDFIKGIIRTDEDLNILLINLANHLHTKLKAT